MADSNHDGIDDQTGQPVGGDPGANPIIQQLLAQNPDIAAQLMGGGLGATQPIDTSDPNWLAAQLQGSAMEVTGREGLTTNPLSSALPPWAQDLAPKVLNSNNFDPYLGIVSQQGDERVFMGGTQPYTKTTKEPVAAPAAPSADGVDFMHGGQPLQDGGASVTKKTHKPGDSTVSATQAKNQPYLWDESKVQETLKRMRKAGINVTSFDDLVSVWGSLVDRAAMTYALSSGQNKVTPWDVLDLYKSEAKATDSYTNYQNGSTTSTQRSVSNVTEGEAFTMLHDQLSRMLGRDPSDQEVREFTFRMNQLAAKNPAITKTIEHYKNGKVVSQDSQTSGGFTADDLSQQAYQDAQNDPQYAEYQSATTYFNAALQALGAIGQTG